jgi:hypothetical protein
LKKILFYNSSPYLTGSLISDLELAKLLVNNGFDVYFLTKINDLKNDYPQIKFLNFFRKFSIKHFDVIFLSESRAREKVHIFRLFYPRAKIFSVRRAMPKSTKLSIFIQNLFSDKILCVSEDIAKKISSKKTFLIYSFVDKIN